MPGCGRTLNVENADTVIKRRYAHMMFGLASASLITVLAFQSVKLYQQKQLSNTLNSVPTSIATLDEVDTTRAMFSHPAVQVSVGSALAQGANLEEAERILNPLITDSSEVAIHTGAQYNLANAYLRQALASGTQATSQSLPMVELAKQRYRDLLRDTPEHWQARYNLERALRMAPEGSDRLDDERIDPVKRVNVVVPGFEKKDLP